MKLLFVNPPRVAGYPVVREERFEHKDMGSVYPPLSLLYCASVTQEKGHQAVLMDANALDKSLDEVIARIDAEKPDAVMIRLGFDTQEPDLAVLKAAKERGLITLARLKIVGDTPWLRDQFMREHSFVDLFFNDEPECLLPPVLEAIDKAETLQGIAGTTVLDQGVPLSTPFKGRLPSPDDLPRPAYHLLDSLKAYHTGVMRAPFAVVQTSRGCPYTCSFCAFGKLAYRVRDVEKVLDELQWLKKEQGLKTFLFFDDVLTLDQRRSTKLMQGLIDRKLNLEWVCCTRADCVSKELLVLMKAAGCHEIAFGIESGSDTVLEETTKNVTKDQIRQAARWCHDVGILFYGLAIIGLPGETEQTVEDTIQFINEIEPFYTQFGYCVPFPNTDTWHWYKERGFLKTEDWAKFFPLDQKPIVRTEALSEEDLVRLRRRMYLKTMLRPRKLLRAIRWNDWAWNLSRVGKLLGRLGKVLRGGSVR